MANNISASFAAKWSKRMQLKLFHTDVFRDLANFEEQPVLTKGQVVHRPYRSSLVVNTMGATGSFQRQDITDTDETLTVGTPKECSFYIQDIDVIESNYATQNLYADDAGRALSNGIDGDFQAQVANALNTVDDADFGGTSGNGVTVTEANVYRMFSLANRKLDNRNAPPVGRFACLSPEFCSILEDYLVNRETDWGDTVGERGYVGMYKGFAIYKTLAAYSTYVLGVATEPTDGDTVTINLPDLQGTRTTITFTFKTTLGSTAGNVLIGGSASASNTNLTALINAPSVTTAQGVALSATAQALLATTVATAAATTTSIAVTGKSFAVVGATLTATTDGWTTATQIQHQMFGVKQLCVDVVIQVEPKMLVKSRDGYVGSDIVSWDAYGMKTFQEGARNMVDVRMRADQLTAS